MKFISRIFTLLILSVICLFLLPGCRWLDEHVQISSSVNPVALQLTDEENLSFVAPELGQAPGFTGLLKESHRPDHRFYKVQTNSLSLTRPEDLLRQPFTIWFPSLNLNEYYGKYFPQKKSFASEAALPIRSEVTLTSLVVDKRRADHPDALYTWKVKLYLEDSNQEKLYLGEKDFQLAIRSITNPKSDTDFPVAPFSGKKFEVKKQQRMQGRDSGYHLLGQNLYNDALKYSILHTSFDILNRNSAKIAYHTKQRKEAINADRIDRHWALVVGVSKYKYNKGGLNNLTYADNDAKSMANVFYEKLNWPRSRIKLLINEKAEKRTIIEQLENIVSRLGKNDMLTIYWSGHGFVNSSETYFACYDTRVEDVSSAISMNKLRAYLENKKINNVFFIADTCHAGALATGTRGLSVTSISNSISPVRQTRQNQGWIYMLAAESDRQAVEDKQWGHGAFTYFLLRGLSGEADGYEGSGNADQVITPAELRAYLRHKVPFETQKSLGTAVHPLIHTNSANAKIWDINIYETE